MTSKTLTMMDGTPLYEYLKNAAPETVPMDEWTRGYEECKRRLFRIIGPQLFRLADETSVAPVVHGVIFDRPGWVCSVCGGWNHLRIDTALTRTR